MITWYLKSQISKPRVMTQEVYLVHRTPHDSCHKGVGLQKVKQVTMQAGIIFLPLLTRVTKPVSSQRTVCTDTNILPLSPEIPQFSNISADNTYVSAPFSKSDFEDALQVCQNKAARLMTKVYMFTPTRVLLRHCGWPDHQSNSLNSSVRISRASTSIREK